MSQSRCFDYFLKSIIEAIFLVTFRMPEAHGNPWAWAMGPWGPHGEPRGTMGPWGDPMGRPVGSHGGAMRSH